MGEGYFLGELRENPSLSFPFLFFSHTHNSMWSNSRTAALPALWSILLRALGLFFDKLLALKSSQADGWHGWTEILQKC